MDGLSKRRGEKYELILEAAVKVFAEKGYANSRVSDVAKGAGIADGTIYLYFSRKEDLLISLFQEKLGDFSSELAFALASITDPNEKLKKIIDFHLTFLGQNKELAIVTQFEIRQSDPEIRDALREPLQKFFHIIQEVIRQGQEKGAFTKDVEISLLRKLVFGTLDEVVTRWVLASRTYELKGLVEPIFKIVQKALQA